MINRSKWNNLKAGDVLITNGGRRRPVVWVDDMYGTVTAKIKTNGCGAEHDHRYLTPSCREEFSNVVKN